ncbi:Nucleoid occlusion protein [subsurface metagenome]
MAKKVSELCNIPPSKIKPNPENPRLIFHEKELRDLRDSISKVGIKVPISVYQDNNDYVLLDGERRWRCAQKLNLKTMPALVQPKPDRLENLLMMFNIHNVRVRWDLLPTAYKLLDVKKMLEKDGNPANKQDLASITGVTVPTVNRAFDLLNLSKRYQNLLRAEIKKPRDQQEFTADLFIEVKRAMKAVEQYTPEVFDKISPAQFIDTMFYKYTHGIENNVVSFRDISKISRAKKTGKSKADVVPIIVKLVKNRRYSISDAYDDSVKADYELSNLASKSSKLAGLLATYPSVTRIPANLKSALRRLHKEISRILGGRK